MEVLVVLTGANQDIQHPQTDAWDNLQFALQSAQSQLSPGVYVAFHQRLIPANEVKKATYNGSSMHYVSYGDEDEKLRQEEKRRVDNKLIEQLLGVMPPFGDMHEAIIDYPVNIVVADHERLFSQVNSNTKAVLLTLYHSGTANTENTSSSVSALIRRLRVENGLVFFGVTENGEPVDLHLYETSVKLREAGLVPLYDMSHDVALKKLELLSDLDAADMIEEMLRNYVGEVSQLAYPNDVKELIKLYS